MHHVKKISCSLQFVASLQNLIVTFVPSVALHQYFSVPLYNSNFQANPSRTFLNLKFAPNFFLCQEFFPNLERFLPMHLLTEAYCADYQFFPLSLRNLMS